MRARSMGGFLASWTRWCSTIGAVDRSLRNLIVPAVIVGVALVVVAVIYFVDAEHSLPSFFPGHSSASSPEANHHHTKHGIAAVLVGIACFVYAWFASGPKSSQTARVDD